MGDHLYTRPLTNPLIRFQPIQNFRLNWQIVPEHVELVWPYGRHSQTLGNLQNFVVIWLAVALIIEIFTSLARHIEILMVGGIIMVFPIEARVYPSIDKPNRSQRPLDNTVVRAVCAYYKFVLRILPFPIMPWLCTLFLLFLMHVFFIWSKSWVDLRRMIPRMKHFRLRRRQAHGCCRVTLILLCIRWPIAWDMKLVCLYFANKIGFRRLLLNHLLFMCSWTTGFCRWL